MNSSRTLLIAMATLSLFFCRPARAQHEPAATDTQTQDSSSTEHPPKERTGAGTSR